MFRGFNAPFDPNVPLEEFKNLVCQAVEQGVPNESKDSNVTEAWERFFSCCEQCRIKATQPIGLVNLDSIGAVIIIKKNAFSLLRPSDWLNSETVNFLVGNETITIDTSDLVKYPMFSVMFKKEWLGKEEISSLGFPVKEIGSIKEFLLYFSKDDVPLTMKNMREVIKLGDYCGVLEEFKELAKKLRDDLNPRNIIWVYQLSLLLQVPELIKYCQDQIRASPKEILLSNVFAECEQDTLKSILELDYLHCYDYDIAKAMIRWANCACNSSGVQQSPENLRRKLGDTLRLMPIRGISQKHLKEIDLFTPDQTEEIRMMNDDINESRYFKMRQRCYKWNPDKVVVCHRKPVAMKEIEYPTIQKVEVVQFTSNKPLLLGSLSTAPIDIVDGKLCRSQSIRNLRVNITIQEANIRHNLFSEDDVSIKKWNLGRLF